MSEAHAYYTNSIYLNIPNLVLITYLSEFLWKSYPNCVLNRSHKDSKASRERLKTVTSESEAVCERKFDSIYKPEDYSAVDKYVWKELIYSLPLSPCKVEIVEDEENGKVGFLGENLILIFLFTALR